MAWALLSFFGRWKNVYRFFRKLGEKDVTYNNLGYDLFGIYYIASYRNTTDISTMVVVGGREGGGGGDVALLLLGNIFSTQRTTSSTLRTRRMMPCLDIAQYVDRRRRRESGRRRRRTVPPPGSSSPDMHILHGTARHKRENILNAKYLLQSVQKECINIIMCVNVLSISSLTRGPDRRSRCIRWPYYNDADIASSFCSPFVSICFRHPPCYLVLALVAVFVLPRREVNHTDFVGTTSRVRH